MLLEHLVAHVDGTHIPLGFEVVEGLDRNGGTMTHLAKSLLLATNEQINTYNKKVNGRPMGSCRARATCVATMECAMENYKHGYVFAVCSVCFQIKKAPTSTVQQLHNTHAPFPPSLLNL